MDANKNSKIELNVGQWRNNWEMYTFGISNRLLPGYSISVLCIISIYAYNLITDKVVKDTIFYFGHIIPSIGLFIASIRYVSLKQANETLFMATIDYIVLKSFFDGLTLACTETSIISLGVIFLIRAAFFQNNGLKSSHCMICVGLLLYILIISPSLVLLFGVLIMFIFAPYLITTRYSTTPAHACVLSSFIIIDSIFNWTAFSQYKFLFNSPESFIFISIYSTLIFFVILLQKRIYRISLSYGILSVLPVTFATLIFDKSANAFNQWLAALAMAFLSIASSRSAVQQTFPPVDQSLTDFRYSTLIYKLRVSPYDKQKISVYIKTVLSKSKSSEKVVLTILDFKLISVLYVLTDLARAENKPIDVFAYSTINSISSYPACFYDAFKRSGNYRSFGYCP